MSKAISLQCFAKINLFLEIVGVRPDGFHEVVMVLQNIDLADTVQITTQREITIRCDHPQVPTNEENIAYKAVQVMQQALGRKDGALIEIEKKIPVAAGLAGGSANAASVLVGLNLLWDAGLTVRELEKLAQLLGSDVPFCIDGGTALAVGRGEILSPLLSFKGIPLVLAKARNLAISTAWAYTTYREQYADAKPAKASNLPLLLSGLVHHDFERMTKHLYNDLERVILPGYAEVAYLKQRMSEAGASGVMMSGSGPSVFGLCSDEAQARSVLSQISQEDQEQFLCHTSDAGVVVCS
jgi:4-diphosphocytidyl-2-C-methyl-D-erythritol kinase